MRLLTSLHSKLVFKRRLSRLVALLKTLVPENTEILDIGCGNGMIDSYLLRERPDLTIKGIDTLVRPETDIEVMGFDGKILPFPPNCFDVVMFIDVLHHTDNPARLIREATRVSRKWVVIKDHYCESVIDRATLKFMDWVGNAGYGVALPYNYLSHAQWQAVFNQSGLVEKYINASLGLYPMPTTSIFDRSLHFIGLFEISRADDMGTESLPHAHAARTTH